MRGPFGYYKSTRALMVGAPRKSELHMQIKPSEVDLAVRESPSAPETLVTAPVLLDPSLLLKISGGGGRPIVEWGRPPIIEWGKPPIVEW